jgi:hypothetical protein
MTPKTKLIWEFLGAKTRFVQEMHELGETKEEILRCLTTSPQSLKNMLDLFNIASPKGKDK